MSIEEIIEQATNGNDNKEYYVQHATTENFIFTDLGIHKQAEWILFVLYTIFYPVSIFFCKSYKNSDYIVKDYYRLYIRRTIKKLEDDNYIDEYIHKYFYISRNAAFYEIEEIKNRHARIDNYRTYGMLIYCVVIPVILTLLIIL